MPFELYQHKQGRRDPTAPSATIQKGGYLTISEAAYQQLGRPDAVALYYNGADQQIGMKGSRADYAYDLRSHPTGRSYRVASTRGFMSHYDIPTDKARKYPARYDEKEKMLIIDLKDGQPVIRGGIVAEDEA